MLFKSVLLALLITSSTAFGGVKIKKGTVSIDDVAVFEYEGAMRIEGSTAMIHSAKTKEPLFTIRTGPNYDGYYHLDVKFVGGSAKAFRFQVISFKKLFGDMNKAGVVDADGHLDLEKAVQYAQLYGRPVRDGVLIISH